MIQFVLGVVAALLTGALVWMFVTLYKLVKKFKWMTDTWKDVMREHSEFAQMYWRNREDDQHALSRRFEDSHQYIEKYFVAKKEIQSEKTLLKG